MLRSDGKQTSSHLQTIFSANDNTLIFNFAVTLQPASGGFQLILPMASMGAFFGQHGFDPREPSERHDECRFVEKSLGLEIPA